MIMNNLDAYTSNTTTITNNINENQDGVVVKLSKQDESNKILRRDVERRRRQEMSNHYAILRSLLPIHYIKGKRSTSDHMNEAANYIKHLEKRVQELKGKRDGLMRKNTSSNNIINPSTASGGDYMSRGISRPSHQPMDCDVTIRLCWPGLEVIVSTTNNNNGAGLLLQPLSRVLQVLMVEDGLNVVKCVSSNVNDRSLYTFQAEIIDHTRMFNTTELQQKLKDLALGRATKLS